MTKKILSLVIFCAALSCAFAKDLPIVPGGYNIDFSKYSFIDSTLNVIQFPKGSAGFEPFFKKLDTLVFENRGQVRILHIGGSHLQADVISGRIREHLIKEYPGANAGRGFIFPYSAAKTNTPSTYASYYKGIWDKNRNIQKEVTMPLGLLGIAVSTSDPRAEISILLDKYNSEPMWGETRFRLFGYSDNNDVVPVLRVDSADIFGVLDTASQSYVFTSPRPIDSIQIQFRWMDSLQQATVAQFLTDSLLQDSIARADSANAGLNADGLNAGDVAQGSPDAASNNAASNNAAGDNAASGNGGNNAAGSVAGTAGNNGAGSAPQNVSEAVANLPTNIALAAPAEAPLDTMFQGDCDLLDTACMAKGDGNGSSESIAAIPPEVADSLKKNARPRFTLTGILSETDAPGITYTGVGINGAKVINYFEETCPLFERQMEFYKPDLVIFAIGINDANVEHFNDKQFIEDYSRLVARIKRVAPDAAIIFETNNDMYRKVKKRRYVQHPNGDIARKAFFTLAEIHKAGVWDKFALMGGLGSMSKWEKADLAKSDKVHFKLAGYNLLGDLFYKALINAYQDHIANLPAQEPAPLQTQPAQTK